MRIKIQMKKKKKEEERRGSEKSNGCPPSFYIGYFGDSFWPKKMHNGRGLFGVSVFKLIRLDIYFIAPRYT